MQMKSFSRERRTSHVTLEDVRAAMAPPKKKVPRHFSSIVKMMLQNISRATSCRAPMNPAIGAVHSDSRFPLPCNSPFRARWDMMVLFFVIVSFEMLFSDSLCMNTNVRRALMKIHIRLPYRMGACIAHTGTSPVNVLL